MDNNTHMHTEDYVNCTLFWERPNVLPKRETANPNDLEEFISLYNAMFFLKQLKQIIGAKENWPVAKSLSMNMSHHP